MSAGADSREWVDLYDTDPPATPPVGAGIVRALRAVARRIVLGR